MLNRPTGTCLWERIAEDLNVSDSIGEIDAKRSDNPGYEMLSEWATRNGSTIAVLMNVLEHRQRNDIVSRINGLRLGMTGSDYNRRQLRPLFSTASFQVL